jgi:predicted signal transduction protein with EAL and GGDEF domain
MKADRNIFLSKVAEQLCADLSDEQLSAIAVVDLREMQQINQVHGYSTVDKALESLFQRLVGITKNPDFCCRIDGDKFALLLTPLLNIQLAPLLANKITGHLMEPFPLGEPPVRLKANLGFAASNPASNAPLFSSVMANAEKLLMEAESAAKTAKQRGDQYIVSEAALFAQNPARLALQEEIADALTNNDFELYYQPKLNLQTRQPSGAEGLIRWHKVKSLDLDSEQLINIIERSGHMLDLFRWTINTALRESAQWPDTFGKLNVAINLSAFCLKYDAIFNQLESSLNLWGVDPSQLCIEVTESAVQEDMLQGFHLLNKLNS